MAGSELVKLQLEKAEEKLDAAEYLLKGRFYEDAVSRAYYSMYYAAKAILTLKNIEPKTHYPRFDLKALCGKVEEVEGLKG